MARTPKDVTEAELSVLRVLWTSGPSTVREIAEALTTRAGTPQVPTIQKLLERLEDKSFVKRDRTGPVQLFEAVADRDELIGRRLQGIAEQLCEGSMTPLLSHLVNADRLTPDDRKALRDLIDQLDNEPSRRKANGN